MIKTYTIEPGQTPTAAQLQEVQEAANCPITFDESCPELSPAMVKAFQSAVVMRNRRRNA